MPEATATNRRQADRKPVARSIVLFVDSEHAQIANNAFAIDLSALGVRIRSTVSLLPGQLVTIVPREGAEQSIRSLVIWVGEAGSKRAGEAGFAFLQPLSQIPE